MTTVTLDHVCEALSTWTGIPAERLHPAGFKIGDPQELRGRLGAVIVGQDDAIEAAVWAMIRRSRLAPRAGEHRPVWAALFSGPSGVGKTQLAKELARVFFGDANRHLIQVDLSDFSEEHTVARLVGAPPGYKGHGEGGELTNALRRTPAGVLLLDEVEKAHPAVLTQVLIPLLGEGTIHDMNDGRLLDARQFIVVMTANLGAGSQDVGPLGFGSDRQEDPARRTMRAIAGHLPPEILGRIDEVVVFDHLSEAAARRIWELEVALLETHLSASGFAIEVRMDEDVVHRLLHDAARRIHSQGARAVRRLFDRAVADRCLELLDGCDRSGSIVVEQADDANLRYRFEAREHRHGA